MFNLQNKLSNHPNFDVGILFASYFKMYLNKIQLNYYIFTYFKKYYIKYIIHNELTMTNAICAVKNYLFLCYNY